MSFLLRDNDWGSRRPWTGATGSNNGQCTSVLTEKPMTSVLKSSSSWAPWLIDGQAASSGS
ncbi:hypothetical protein MAR_016956 [Mya arenaria]|uniref:Uncharacterized protein n=1 Tax=Mya arenaria TaxID=6604 RepID=A0ABY7EE74_MYAAR|nr:hypothetical protein MAR_016956 [Mya arenaria]